jgi:hypothetical protein
MRIIEELLEMKVAAPVKKTEINGLRDSLHCRWDTLYPLKLASWTGDRNLRKNTWRRREIF